MRQKPKKIIVVVGSKEHYAHHAQNIARILEDERNNTPLVVTVLKTEQEAREKLIRRETDIAIFVSMDDYPAAQRLKQEFPSLIAFVLAEGEIKDQPYVIPISHRLLNIETIRNIARLF